MPPLDVGLAVKGGANFPGTHDRKEPEAAMLLVRFSLCFPAGVIFSLGFGLWASWAWRLAYGIDEGWDRLVIKPSV